MPTPAQLERPPLNKLESRAERSISSDGVEPCRCGRMPLGVEFYPISHDDIENEVGSLVVIECPRCYNAAMTGGVDYAKEIWNAECSCEGREKSLAT